MIGRNLQPRILYPAILSFRFDGETKSFPEKQKLKRIAENFPNMGKEIVNQVQEAQRVPGRINPRRNTARHTVIKLTKIKGRDKILKATMEK